jgi:RNA polymerase sigma factor (sigma-70 family)
MSQPRLGPVVRQLHHLATLAVDDKLGDGCLLERFTTQNDADAFAALVRRHGPLVWRVCRRLVGRAELAEDCVQATFLIFATRARSIRKPAALASWLYGVAFRVARRARARARRHAHEKGDAPERLATSPEPGQAAAWRELGQIVEEEVHALPETLRLPVLICYWQGLTNEEAACQLGWPVGTVKTRLARARALLHERLVRRGVTLPAGTLVLLLVPGASEATVSGALLAAVLRTAGGTSASAPVASAVSELASGAFYTASLAKAMAALALALVVGLTALGVSFFTGQAQSEPPADEPKPQAAPANPPQVPPPLVDAYGDALPPEALARLGTTRFRQGGRVNAIAFSADGETLASAGWNETVRLWQAATGKELLQLGPHDRAAVSVAFAPHGKTVATGTWFGSTYVWDAVTGKQLRKFPGSPGGVTAVAISPDGKALAVGGSAADRVRLWDIATGTALHSLSGGQASLASENTPDTSVAFSPNGKILAAAHGNVIRLWNVATGELIRELQGHSQRIFTVAFVPGHDALASGAGDGTIRLWDLADGKELRRIDAAARNGRVHALALSHDGKVLASGSHDMLRLWDIATGGELQSTGGRKPGLMSDVLSVALSSKGQLAAGYYNGTVRSWRLPQTEKLLRPVANPFAPNWGDAFLGAGRGHHEGLTAVSVAPGGKTVATAGGDRTVRLWDLATARERQRLDGTGVVFAPAGPVFATFGRDGPICLRELPSGKELNRFPGWSPALTADGKFVAHVSEAEGKPWASGYCDIVLREAATGRLLKRLRGHPGSIHCLAFSPDGTILASGADGQRTQGPNVHQAPRVVDTIRLWDVATAQVRLQFGGDKHSVYSLAFSPDGRSLASGAYTTGTYKKGMPQAEHDSPVRIWEVATGRQRAVLHGHQGWVTSVAFSPDGRRVAAGGLDHSVRLWDALTGQQTRCWLGHRDMVTAVAFVPGGKALVSASSDTTALVWTVPAPGPGPAAPAKNLAPQEIDNLWADLGGTDAARAYRAIAALVADPARSLPLLRQRLRPVQPAGKEVTRLIEALGDDDFDARSRATRALEAMGEAAGPALRQALDQQLALEARRRVERLIAMVDAEALRAVRAVEVLERLASPDVLPLLEALAKGMPKARLSQEAQSALARMKKLVTIVPGG